MGQAKSKPPTRVIVTDDTIIADNVNADDDLDVINNNVDTVSMLGERGESQGQNYSANGKHVQNIAKIRR